MEDKRKQINDLQKVLKARENSYDDLLKKNIEEIDQIAEKIKDTINTLTDKYRNELAEVETLHLQNFKAIILSEDNKFDNILVKAWENELKELKKRQKTIREHEKKLYKKIWKFFKIENNARAKNAAEQQAYDIRQQHEKEATLMPMLTHVQQEFKDQVFTTNLLKKEQVILNLKADVKKLKLKDEALMKAHEEKRQQLAKEHKLCLERHERILRKCKDLKVADAKRQKEVWCTIDKEVKQKVERALKMDSLISNQYLGLPCELHSPSASARPQDVILNAAQPKTYVYTQMMIDVGPLLSSDSEGETNIESHGKVFKVLCDEAGYLVEDKLLMVFQQMGEKELDRLKLMFLLSKMGIKNKDFPELISFLEKYSKTAEPFDTAETEALQECIHPNHILPALKSFLKQHRKPEVNSAKPNKKIQSISTELTYWNSLPNVISKDKLKLWDVAESLYSKYSEFLTELSYLVANSKSSQRQNSSHFPTGKPSH